MAPRAYWKGYLKLSLVSCPIALNPATSSSERISFRQINKKTGNRLRQLLVDEGTREPVETQDKGKGYEVSKNEFMLLDDDELDALEIESNHTIEIDSFVPAAQIDKRYYDSSYYIVPNDRVGQEAFAVIRDAMKGKGMVALGRVVMSKRERVVALEPHEKGLLGTTLRYPYEVRRAEDYFEEIADIQVPNEMLKLAEHILETKAGNFDPAQFKDRYEEALIEFLRKKQAHVPVKAAKEATPAPNVINLMDALRRSVQAERKTGSPAGSQPAPVRAERAVAAPAERPTAAPTPAKKPRKRVAGQTEMLLPIQGKKAAQGASEGRKAPQEPIKTVAKETMKAVKTVRPGPRRKAG
jgi:DNA end-binding protein Ku